MSQITFSSLLAIWKLQGIVLAVSVILSLGFNVVFAYSILLGGLIYLIPNIYFAYYAFRYTFRQKGAHLAPYVLMSFYRGEIGKFLLSSVGFALAFTFAKPLNIALLFGSYIVLTIIQWVMFSRFRQ